MDALLRPVQRRFESQLCVSSDVEKGCDVLSRMVERMHQKIFHFCKSS